MASIKEIEIEGFKAFPNKINLTLDKNLLIYGENGSGKSSIYYALHALLQSVYKADKGAKKAKKILSIYISWMRSEIMGLYLM